MIRIIDSSYKRLVHIVGVILVVCIITFIGTGCSNDPKASSESSTSSAYTAPGPEGTGAETAPDRPTGDIAPMVFAENKLWIIDYTQDEWKLEEVGLEQSYIGKISSFTADGSVPTDELQANDDIVGAKVYRIENGIAVFFDGKCMVYRPYGGAEACYPPMVMVGGKLYKDTGYVNSAVTCGTADGRITSSVGGKRMPEKDDQANFGDGYEYQYWDDDSVNVKIDGKWCLFRDPDMSADEMPDCVASFIADVLEDADGRLLVDPVDAPDAFKWLINEWSNPKIKPISLPTENLWIPSEDGGRKPGTESLLGKRVQVWFDGTIKNDQPEMSYPVELGEVYRITPVES